LSESGNRVLEHKENILKTTSSMNKNTQAQFNLAISNGVTINYRSNQLENIEHHNDTSLTVTVYNDFKKGSASTNNLSFDSIKQTLDKATNIAINTQKDNCQGLPRESFTTCESQDIGIYFPKQFEIDEATELTKICESAGFEYDKRISNSEGSSYSQSNSECLILNSQGMYGHFKSTDYSLSCVMLAGDNQAMERDYWYSSTRRYENLESPQEIGKKASSRAISRLNAKTISSRVCPIIFPAEVATSFFNNFLSAINGHAIYKKSSFLLDKLGSEIFPEFITIREDPSIVEGMGTRPFDSDGVLTERKNIINKGILETYLLDTYSARKLNLNCTGNGVLTNILVESSEEQTDNLINLVDEGVIITEMMGSGANLLTGDYSRGAFGYYFKDGQIKYPVTGITVASNLTQMFKNILHVGKDYDIRGNIRTGSILIDKVTIGGT